MLPANLPAPHFALPDQSGAVRTLEEFKGKYVVVYFYPKEGTPGCIKEACAIRDAYPEFEKLGVAVLGISVGSPKEHADFAATYKLPFTLLSDFEQQTARSYGAKGLFFSKRVSYLIGPTGSVLKTYPAVDPTTHISELLSDVRLEIARDGVFNNTPA